MEMESMFTEQKWNILRELSSEKASPLQLAEKLNTTMANISQQLRLLEASNLVKKEKIKNRDKGKPRTLFSLTHDHAYLVSAMNNFAAKKLVHLNEHQKATVRIWFIEDEELQHKAEKLYWNLLDALDKVDAIIADQGNKALLVLTKEREAVREISEKTGIGVGRA